MQFLDSVMAVLVALSTNPVKNVENDIKVIVDPQLACLAQNIYHEARNQSTAGMFAVANVTMNRVKSEAFPNTICEVVYEGPHYKNSSGRYYPYKNRCQFSWYCDGKDDTIRNISKYEDIYILSSAFLRSKLDLTDGALFYHADYVEPGWASRLEKTAVIDTHIFYKPKD